MILRKYRPDGQLAPAPATPASPDAKAGQEPFDAFRVSSLGGKGFRGGHGPRS